MCLALVAKEVTADSSLVDIPLPPHIHVSEPAENFAKHIHDLHGEIRRKISLSNEEYKLVADVHLDLRNLVLVTLSWFAFVLKEFQKCFQKNFKQEPWALIISFVKWDPMHIFLICLMTWILALFLM